MLNSVLFKIKVLISKSIFKEHYFDVYFEMSCLEKALIFKGAYFQNPIFFLSLTLLCEKWKVVFCLIFLEKHQF